MRNSVDAFQKLQESLRALAQPKIKEGYKSAKEIAKELGRNYHTVRLELGRAAEEKLIPVEYYTVNRNKTAFYKL